MSNTEDKRAIELEIEIPASAESVWAALTKASQITNWFAPEARVDGREGGEYWVSWGGGMDMGLNIEVLDAPKHLRLVEERDVASVKHRLAVDFYIEAQGGSTKLRLVHSGFGPEASWDGEIDGLTKGWTVFLKHLRNAVSKPQCRGIMRTLMVPRAATELWSHFVGDVEAGAPFSKTWAEPVSGNVEFILPPHMFLATFQERGDAHIAWMLEGAGSHTSVTILVQTFGLNDAEYNEARRIWVSWVEQAVTL